MTAPGTRKKRPLSVILLQVLLAVFFAIYAGALGNALRYVARQGSRVSLLPFVASVSIRLIPLLVMGWTFWALMKRKPYGRWLGLLCIFALPASRIYQFVHGGSHRFVPGAMSARELGEVFGEGTAYLLIVWWLYSFGFSQATKAFWAGTVPAASTIEVEPHEG